MTARRYQYSIHPLGMRTPWPSKVTLYPRGAGAAGQDAQQILFAPRGERTAVSRHQK